jgi:hypothetical protein
MAVSMAGVRGLGLLAVLAATGNAAAKQNDRGTALAITVRVRDYAQVPHKMLEEAEQVSAGILGQEGIHVIWLNCPSPECQRPFLFTDLYLRILPESMADLLPFNNEIYGFAAISADQGPSYLASVFYHRVKKLTDELGYCPANILGYVMAHELGHLLLRSSGHSSYGIMKACATRKDLLPPWRFTPAQAQLMRTDVSARMAAGQNRPQ